MTLLLTLLLLFQAAPGAPGDELKEKILGNEDFDVVLERGREVVGSGLNAGSGYGEVWIRDLNTFIELALEVQDPAQLRRALLVFFHFQGEDGNIIDGYIPAESATGGYDYIVSQTMPELRGHKNTVETDQESSLVQAIHTYVRVTGDRSILDEVVAGRSVRERMADAFRFLLEHRYAGEYGLLWGATTVDWGDVQPEHDWGVALDESSHLAVDVYDNAMFVLALRAYVDLLGAGDPSAAAWSATADRIAANVREHLWDPALHKFRPHLYLEDSPFPDDFDEHRIYYHGGTAVAAAAGLLTPEEVGLVYRDMVNNVRFADAASIGLTVYPPYPEGWFKNPSMGRFSYQNGGDWTWFGARMIPQLVANGYVEEAYEALLPMVERVVANDGFFEWYTVDNEPRGSGTFRGSAGVLADAIHALRAWAEAQE